MSNIFNDRKINHVLILLLIWGATLGGSILFSGCKKSSESAINVQEIDPAAVVAHQANTERQTTIKSDYRKAVADYREQTQTAKEDEDRFVGFIDSCQVSEPSLIEFTEKVAKSVIEEYKNLYDLKVQTEHTMQQAKKLVDDTKESLDDAKKLEKDIEKSPMHLDMSIRESGTFLSKAWSNTNELEKLYEQVKRDATSTLSTFHEAESRFRAMDKRLEIAYGVLVKVREQNNVPDPDKMLAIKNEYQKIAVDWGCDPNIFPECRLQPYEMYSQNIESLLGYAEQIKKSAKSYSNSFRDPKIGGPVVEKANSRAYYANVLYDCVDYVQKTGEILPDVLTVPKDIKQIEKAIKILRKDGKLMIQNGNYSLSEPLQIVRSVHIIGETGDPKDVIIDCDKNRFICVSFPHVTLHGLTFNTNKDLEAFRIENGNCQIENCVFDASDGIAVSVLGEGANPVFKSCTFTGGTFGVLVLNRGKGKFEKCIFSDAKTGGFGVAHQGAPQVYDCTFHNNGHGIVVYQNGWGTFENCIVTGNSSHGIYVHTQGDPMIRKGKIANNGGSGIHIENGGSGSYDGNELSENAKGAWSITADTKNVLRVDNVPEQ